MRKEENGRIVETALEARGARLGRPVLLMLVVGTALAIAAFLVIYLVS